MRLGYAVVEAGAQALQLATDPARSFELFVTDMTMPEMGGQERSRKILETCPAMKTVQMSG